jgi:hypothetical protein
LPDASGKVVVEQLKPGSYSAEVRQEGKRFVTLLVVIGQE